MTIYDDFVQLAQRHSQQFNAQKDACAAATKKLVIALSNYLQAPADTISYVEVLPGYAMGKNLESVLKSLPVLGHGKDGFWYFAIQIYFGKQGALGFYGLQKSLFGIKQTNSGFVLRSSKDAPIDPDDEKSLFAFVDSFCDELRAFYETPVNEPAKKIGFVAN